MAGGPCLCRTVPGGPFGHLYTHAVQACERDIMYDEESLTSDSLDEANERVPVVLDSMDAAGDEVLMVVDSMDDRAGEKVFVNN
uniref:Uncharacterized protein n=1 Tax=Oryza meridionalis TaxID=40149 RepID=A0A0E0DUE0_9ORYZ